MTNLPPAQIRQKHEMTNPLPAQIGQKRKMTNPPIPAQTGQNFLKTRHCSLLALMNIRYSGPYVERTFVGIQ